MPYSSGNVRRLALPALVLFLSLAGCGGGSSGDPSDTQAPPPPPPPSSISGIAMLGPVANADVTVIGTGDVLGTGQTGADGRFGPIEYSGEYSGPLRIEVTGNGASTWICDFRFGCDVDGRSHLPGEAIDFDGTLSAVLPNAGDGQFVSVSLLSNIVSERIEVLGGLNESYVDAAAADIAVLLRAVLAEAISRHDLEIPDDFSVVELFDVRQPPSPGGNDDALRTVLSLLNSSLLDFSVETQTTGEFIESFSRAVAEQPDLPVSGPDRVDLSLESVMRAMYSQVIDIRTSSEFDLIDALSDLLAPGNVDTLLNAVYDAYNGLPTLIVVRPSFDYEVFVDDFALQAPITHSLEVVTSTGQSPGLQDFGALVTPDTGGLWLSASTEMVDGAAHVRLDFDRAQLEALNSGFYRAVVETYDKTGQYARDYLPVILQLNVIGKVVDAGFDFNAQERATVSLNGSANTADDVQSINWVQVDGPAVTIEHGNTFSPNIALPSVDASVSVTLRLDVEFVTGESRSDSITVGVIAFPNIADQVLADSALQQCIDDAAADGGFVETPELTILNCSGVASLGGIGAFTGLVSLELPGNSIDSLAPLLELQDLQFLNVSGTPGLPCAEIDALAERLDEGNELLVHDICTGSVDLGLGAEGFDSVLDDARGQFYVSLPNRHEIAVIAMAGLRIVDRISVPGSPQGIDLSIDGTRLFAALNGSNAVAVVDIGARTVSTIPLGDSTGHALTYDVLEGAPERLFVSASPGSGGFAWIAQVRLDQGNLATRVADERIIRARPVFARDPLQTFVYLGSGFSPNSLYKLNLLEPNAPIVLEDAHGDVGGTDNLVLNAAGSRIALSSGQVLRTGSFVEEGRVSGGRSAASAVTDTLFVARDGGSEIEAYDFTSLELLSTTPTGCDNGTTTRLHAYGGDESFMLLQGETACLYTELSRTVPADPFAALRFPDLAFEECVIDAAVAAGFDAPEEFLVLDCSATTGSILSIEGIERLTNLEHLILSNSGVFDLSPLAAHPALQSLVARNVQLGALDALFGLAALSSVDVTGNGAVPCTDLDQLVANGVAVQADQCAETVRIELGGIGADLVLDETGDRAIVSIPSLQQVAGIDLSTGSITRSDTLTAQPRGIDLSADRQTLYAALHGVGDMAVLDAATFNVAEVVDLSERLDSDFTWDIAEVAPDRIVVSSSPGSGGFAYIVEVRRDLGNQATRVADERIIRASPIFAIGSDGFVYVGEGLSPNSLYKLDADPAGLLPVVLEDDHGEVSGTDNLALSPDGTRIYLRFGQVLDTGTFFQVAQFPAGRSIVSSDGNSLFIGDTESDEALVYDAATTGQVGTRTWGCDLAQLTVLRQYGDGVLALGDDLVCYSRTVSYP